ncbi:MAG: PHP domain-containing protein [Clostridium sp.]|nr:PHP domain-containing protein [Clostridium sp.]
MYLKGDFHIHSNKSDGIFDPRELVEMAKKENIDIMALTDHDTTDGLEEALSAGISLNVKIIKGMELSTRYNGENIHVLSYFRDDSYKSEKFQNILMDVNKLRVARAEKIVNNLKKYFNIEIDFAKVLKSAKGVVARPHIARTIIDTGYNYTLDYIFKNILNERSPAYVPNENLSLKDGIAFLKSANAAAVLAHPVLAKKTPVKELMRQFDFDGIEAIYPLNSKENTEDFIKIAEDNGKIITAGSDFHSGLAADTKHGTLGSIYLGSTHIEQFLKLLNIN